MKQEKYKIIVEKVVETPEKIVFEIYDAALLRTLNQRFKSDWDYIYEQIDKKTDKSILLITNKSFR